MGLAPSDTSHDVAVVSRGVVLYVCWVTFYIGDISAESGERVAADVCT